MSLNVVNGFKIVPVDGLSFSHCDSSRFLSFAHFKLIHYKQINFWRSHSHDDKYVSKANSEDRRLNFYSWTDFRLHILEQPEFLFSHI